MTINYMSKADFIEWLTPERRAAVEAMLAAEICPKMLEAIAALRALHEASLQLKRVAR